MIPTKGTHPELNVFFIGALVIKIMKRRTGKRMKIRQVFDVLSSELDVSIDHIILALDWLYMTSIIQIEGNEVFINENY